MMFQWFKLQKYADYYLVPSFTAQPKRMAKLRLPIVPGTEWEDIFMQERLQDEDDDEEDKDEDEEPLHYR